METGLMIALGIALVVGLILIFFNSTPSEAAKYKKTLEYVRFDADEILTENLLRKRLNLVELDAYWEQFLPLLKHEIVLKINPTDENGIASGSSKAGGFPHLSPETTINPYWTFIAQINCGEAKPFDKDNVFPSQGTLYFFLDPSKLETKAIDAVSVLYTPTIENLETNTEILSLPDVHQGRLQFFEGVSLPQYDADIIKNTLKEYEVDGYFKATNREQSHKMGGYPDTITQDFEVDKNKILLLQLDSDSSLGMLWGNMGRLYIFADRQSVLSCKFDKIYTYIQSYEEESA